MSSTRARGLVALAAVIALAGILLVELPFTSGSLRAGQRAPETFRVPSDRTAVDEAATERARHQASDAVEQQYLVDQAANTAMVKDVNDFFDFAEATRQAAPTADERYERLKV